MTLSATTAVDRYNASEGQTVFPYTFKILDADELAAFTGDTEVSSGYTVSGVGDDNGGNVTFSTAPRGVGDDALVVTLKRSLPFDQPTDIPSQGALSTVSLENALDRLVMQLQQLNEEKARSILLAVSSSLTNLTITPEAGKLLGWNGAGTELANFATSTVSQDGVIPTSFAESLLDDADAEEARGTLSAGKANAAQTIEIGSGAIAPSGPGRIVVQAETSTSDDLATITAWSDIKAGDRVTLVADTGDTITVKGASPGNVTLTRSLDRNLSETLALTLEWDGAASEWREPAAPSVDLAAIAALTSAANKGLAATGAGQWSLFDLVTGGSWTPTITAATPPTSQVYAAQTGGYVRVGSLVVAWFYMDATSFSGGSGDLYIGGLPLAASNQNHAGGGTLSRAQNLNLSTNYTWATLEPLANTQNIRVFEHGDNVASQALDLSGLTGALLLAGVVIYPTG